MTEEVITGSQPVMTGGADLVMTEHAAWTGIVTARRRVVALPGGGRWLVSADGGQIAFAAITGPGGPPRAEVFAMPAGGLAAVPELGRALGVLGRVARVRNEDLWDAIATAIVRQVIRAGQARRMYRAFCAAHGEQVRTGNGLFALFPSPDTILRLGDADFAAAGMAFKRRALRSAAAAFLEHGATWRQLPPAALAGELQSVPRIGPWTAGAAAADWSNDFTVYPCADLAVRTWARTAAPAYPWPADEPGFGWVWRAVTGADLSAVTALTLAWGSHHAAAR